MGIEDNRFPDFHPDNRASADESAVALEQTVPIFRIDVNYSFFTDSPTRKIQTDGDLSIQLRAQGSKSLPVPSQDPRLLQLLFYALVVSLVSCKLQYSQQRKDEQYTQLSR